MNSGTIISRKTYEFIIPPPLVKYINPSFDYRGPASTREHLAEAIVLFHPTLQDLIFPLFPSDTKEKLANTYQAWVVPFLESEHTFEPSGLRLNIFNFKFDYGKVQPVISTDRLYLFGLGCRLT